VSPFCPSLICYHAPAPSDVYTLSLHDALPILQDGRLTGAVLEFRAAFGPEQAAFRAEASGDTMALHLLAPEAQSTATTVTLRRVQALPDVLLKPLVTTAPA